MIIFLITLFSLIIPVILAPFGFPFGVFFSLLFRHKKFVKDDDFEIQFDKEILELKNYKKIKAEIKTRDHLKLKAEYFDFGFKKAVILIPGYKNSPYFNFSDSAKVFVQNGYNLLMTHQRAYGKHTGHYCGTGLKEQYDLLQWIDYLSKNTDCQSIVIYGVSMGAATVAYCSEKIKDEKVKTLLIDSAYTSFYDMLYLSASKRKIMGPLVLKVIPFLAKTFLKINLKSQTSDCLKNNKIPSIFLAGSDDKTVPVSNFLNLYYNNSSEKLLIIVPGASHIKAFTVGGPVVQKKIFDFIKKVDC